MADMELVNIAEFRRSGMLREVNEQYFWPRGLALTVTINDETGESVLCGIQKLPTQNETDKTGQAQEIDR